MATSSEARGAGPAVSGGGAAAEISARNVSTAASRKSNWWQSDGECRSPGRCRCAQCITFPRHTPERGRAFVVPDHSRDRSSKQKTPHSLRLEFSPSASGSSAGGIFKPSHAKGCTGPRTAMRRNKSRSSIAARIFPRKASPLSPVRDGGSFEIFCGRAPQGVGISEDMAARFSHARSPGRRNSHETRRSCRHDLGRTTRPGGKKKKKYGGLVFSFLVLIVAARFGRFGSSRGTSCRAHLLEDNRRAAPPRTGTVFFIPGSRRHPAPLYLANATPALFCVKRLLQLRTTVGFQGNRGLGQPAYGMRYIKKKI